MNTLEQHNVKTAVAFIESLWTQGDLELTGQPFAQQMSEAFTDRHYRLDEIFAQDERVTVRLLITGTHSSMFAGNPPTNKSVTITQFREFRIVRGEIVEQHAWLDTGTLLPQIQAR